YAAGDPLRDVVPDWSGVLAAGSAGATTLGIPEGQPVDGKSFAPEFLGQLTPGVRAHFYASGATSDATKAPSPFTIAPEVTARVISATPAGGLRVGVQGDGFRGVTNPGDKGVYVGLAEAGGLPDVSELPTDQTGPFA